MSVLVVTVARHLEVGHLRAALAAHRLTLRVLLTYQRLHFQFPELQIGLHAEQRLTASNKARVQVHRYVARLNTLDNVILFALVRQFQVLLVERERCLRVVRQVEIQLIAHLTVHAHLYLLVEIEDVVITSTLRKARIFNVLVLKSEEQFRRPLHLQLHTARSEHLVRRTDVELHVRDVELLLVVVLHLAYLLLPVLVHRLLLAVRRILLRRHQVRRRDIHIANLRVNHIVPRVRLILHLRLHIRGVAQVQTALRQRQRLIILCPQLLHLRRCPIRRIVRIKHQRVFFHGGAVSRPHR